ncbi:MAG: DUF2461 family protein, partial [Cyclobacteriaceae bacterium]|nr:DUF2461 family protein [Cyclobacteriaceae bacterium]
MTRSLKPVFNFLVSLKEHNERVWFNDHKKLYEESH